MTVAATGGSTNAALHLPAMAHEAASSSTCSDVGEIFSQTPYIAPEAAGNMSPRICSTPAVSRCDEACSRAVSARRLLTVTGKTDPQNLEKVKFNTDQDASAPPGTRSRRPAASSRSRATSAPTGAIVKVARFEEPTVSSAGRVFDNEKPASRRQQRAPTRKRGSRYPSRAQGRPGMREMLSDGRRRLRPGHGRTRLRSSRRPVSARTRGFCIGHVGRKQRLAVRSR